jgi:hypothetical protein
MQHLAVKAAVAEVTDLGEFTAIAAVFGNVDRDGDRIVKGAFADSIEAWNSTGRSVPLHWNHSSDPDDIIGFVDPGSMVETDRGLVVDGQLDLGDSDRARKARDDQSGRWRRSPLALPWGSEAIDEHEWVGRSGAPRPRGGGNLGPAGAMTKGAKPRWQSVGHRWTCGVQRLSGQRSLSTSANGSNRPAATASPASNRAGGVAPEGRSVGASALLGSGV